MSFFIKISKFNLNTLSYINLSKTRNIKANNIIGAYGCKFLSKAAMPSLKNLNLCKYYAI